MDKLIKTALERWSVIKRLDRGLSHSILVAVPFAGAWFLVAFYLDLHIAFEAMGGGIIGAAGVVGSAIFFPLTLGLAPVFAFVRFGDLIPLVITYGLYLALFLVAAPHTGWYGLRVKK